MCICTDCAENAKGWCSKHERFCHIVKEYCKRKKTKRTIKKVKNIETGIIYDNAEEAARATGLRRGNISKVCGGFQEHTGGMHFEYVR